MTYPQKREPKIPELKPCPFCGSDDLDAKGWTSLAASGPSCMQCGATAESVKVWNTRPAEQRIQWLEQENNRLNSEATAHLQACAVRLKELERRALIAEKALKGATARPEMWIRWADKVLMEEGAITPMKDGEQP